MSIETVITFSVEVDEVKHSDWTVRYQSSEEPYRYWVESSIGYKGGSHGNYLSAMHEAKSMVNAIKETSDKNTVKVTAW